MSTDPVLHALIDMCQAVEVQGMVGPATPAYENAMKVIRERTQPGGRLASPEETRAKIQAAHDHLMNLQPHIAQLPKQYQGFIDPHVDEAMKLLSACLPQKDAS